MKTIDAKSLKHRVLSREEEYELAMRHRAGEKGAGNKLVMANLRYAMKVAQQFHKKNPHFLLEDLSQEANIGLIRALNRYDPDHGFRFVSYATWWVRAQLVMYAQHNVSIVRYGTSQSQRTVFGRVQSVIARLTQQNPGLSELEVMELAAVELAVDFEELRIMEQRISTGSVLSLNTRISNDADSDTIFQERLIDRKALADELCDENRRADAVRLAVSWVAKRDIEVAIVKERLMSDSPTTFEELGRRFKKANGERLSRERVRQIEAALKERLRHVLAMAA